MEAASAQQSFTDAQLIDQVDRSLRSFVESRPLPKSLIDAITYALFGGGKRIRPVLCLRACLAVGGDISKALPAAGAVELIHTFSLVHDDLPAMDDDDLRRGRPTLHKHTSEAMAVLAGDAMTALAFELIAQPSADPATDPAANALTAALTAELAQSTNAMIAGQVYDTMGGQPADLTPIQQLRLTHHHKTAALLRAAVRMGALAGGAHGEPLQALSYYADAIGLMFQAVDDLLDVTQTADQMGKATHKDADQGKLTYPGLVGIEGTRAEVDKLRGLASESLAGFDAQAQPLRQMAEQLATRQR